MARQWQKLTDGGPDVLLDSDELLATFFIPLPDFMRIPDNTVMTTYMSIDSSVIAWLDSYGPIPPRTGVDPGFPNSTNLVDTALLAGSTVFRRYEADIVEVSELPLMAEMFTRHMPGTTRARAPKKPDGESPNLFRSVAEIAIPLDSVSFDLSLSNATAGPRIRNKKDISHEFLRSALDSALEVLRSRQSAYYGATRTAVTLMQFELLPPVILIAIRSLNEIADGVEISPNPFVTGNTPTQIGVINDLSEDEMLKFQHAASSSSPFNLYLDLYRQGTVALARGNTRECVVMMATAAESVVNVFLAHLQWEECLTPELSANEWSSSVDTRIKTSFHNRLGGVWSATVPGPIQDWERQVAAIRHRVVHAGYKPTTGEARSSLDALNSLVSYFGNRVVHSGNLRKYPRTAIALLGVEGLKRRNRYTRAVRDLLSDSSELKWDEVFARWYETQIRCIQDLTSPRRSELSRANYFLVFKSKDHYEWIASDWSTRQAVKVDITPAKGTFDPVQSIARSFSSPGKEQVNFPVSAVLPGDAVDAASLQGDWVEDYHLLPMHGVMRDSSDFVR
ncbi:hypothetical protein [Arthrobacter sp. Y81]|uniref:hypothetical protein n=1 Tax=Arthrobacter sp. Y81 TaxID=2058897 RepID=UPI0011B09EDC|nr:hypothetical protein [Arthrobacter sp. Y81]